MNRIINTLALATAGLVLLCGCSADPATDEAAPGGNDGKTVPVSFAAELPATRATIEIGDDRFNGAWEVDIDKLGIHATLNGVAQINKPFVFSSEGIFKGELTPGTGAWTYLAYYPHGEQSLNGTSATIPCRQYPHPEGRNLQQPVRHSDSTRTNYGQFSGRRR